MSCTWAFVFRWMTSRPSCNLVGSKRLLRMRLSQPTIAFSGVRISWLSVARNTILGAVRLIGFPPRRLLVREKRVSGVFALFGETVYGFGKRLIDRLVESGQVVNVSEIRGRLTGPPEAEHACPKSAVLGDHSLQSQNQTSTRTVPCDDDALSKCRCPGAALLPFRFLAPLAFSLIGLHVLRSLNGGSSRRRLALPPRVPTPAPGQMLRANASHSTRMGSTFARMKSASRMNPKLYQRGHRSTRRRCAAFPRWSAEASHCSGRSPTPPRKKTVRDLILEACAAAEAVHPVISPRSGALHARERPAASFPRRPKTNAHRYRASQLRSRSASAARAAPLRGRAREPVTSRAHAPASKTLAVRSARVCLFSPAEFFVLLLLSKERKTPFGRKHYGK